MDGRPACVSDASVGLRAGFQNQKEPATRREALEGLGTHARTHPRTQVWVLEIRKSNLIVKERAGGGTGSRSCLARGEKREGTRWLAG